MTDFENKIELEIPAFLRGELPAEDMQRIEALAAKNPEIAADIEFQRNLMSAVKQDVADSSVGEFGWARLSKAMNEDVKAEVSTPQASNNTHSKPLTFWRVAAAALAVITLGQAGVIATKSLNPDDTTRYQMVSEIPFIGVDVAFQANASEMHMTQLLQSVNGSLVSGPSALGLYKVKFESKDMCLQAVKTFKAASKVIDTASNCE